MELWSKRARELEPYTAGEQPKIKNIIKLNTNENAFLPSPKFFETAAEVKSLNRYPRTEADALRSAAAKINGVKESNIFCANGSDEALALCYYAFFDENREIAITDVTYGFYDVWARFFGIPFKTVPLKEDFTVDVPNMTAEGGVLLPNPNAPTGVYLGLDGIRRLLDNNKGRVVIIDEAYIAFGGESAVSLLCEYENLVIVRTLSKSHSLAGMRIGYVIAHEGLISALNAVKNSFNSYPLDSVAQAGGAAALLDTKYYDKTRTEIIKTREYTVRGLKRLGAEVLPSKANFVFMRFAEISGKTVFERLREKGIIVRRWDKPRIEDYMRVTIGTRQEMEVFISALEKIIGEK